MSLLALLMDRESLSSQAFEPKPPLGDCVAVATSGSWSCVPYLLQAGEIANERLYRYSGLSKEDVQGRCNIVFVGLNGAAPSSRQG